MKQLLLILFCLSLISCSPVVKGMVKTEYIKQEIPELPEEPSYYKVEWHKVNGSYCVDKENAKNLLKNIELMRGYSQELRLILEELKNDHTGNRTSNN